MSTWERPVSATTAAATREGKIQGRRKTPSFSSSLLDAIYHSIDVSEGKEDERGGTENNGSAALHGRRNHALKVEEEIANLRRAIRVEKWMENYSSAPASRASSRRVNSDSSSSTDSSFFSSSETESASKSSSSYSSTALNPNSKPEGRFIMRTKSRALKIYGDLKKVKQPISPGGKIANFLNSIFNSRNVKKHHHHHQGVVVVEDWNTAVRKSRSVNYSTPNRQPSPPPPPPCSRTKSNKRSVRFCPVGVIVDEYSQPCGHMNIYNDNDPSLTPIPSISSHYIKKNIDSFRNYEEKNPKKKHKYRGFYNVDDDDHDSYDDDKSCTSSDLFELENIGFGGGNREELPVYGTTNLKINQAIAKGLLVV